MAKRKAKRFSAEKEVKAIARERVGRVKPGQVIVPKSARKPKYSVNPALAEPED
jgi:hypothetical protein